MSQPDTKERILDAAERLFAREGFHNTSLRAITSEAGANLAAVNYHFGSKEALIEAVFERRLNPLNRIRRENIERVREEAQQAGKRPDVDQILRAFIEPTLRFRDSGPGAENFVTLVGHALAEPDETVRNLFLSQMRPLFFLLFETLGLALPHVGKNTLFWRLHFALGTLGHALCWSGRIRQQPHLLPEGIMLTTDADPLCNMLIEFLTAGMEAPCE